MRKAQKKQIEELIMLMAEAQTEIKNAIQNMNIPLALELLEQCQQGAIQIGTSIDRLEGEGHPTVTLLEQYCELVYNLHEELANGSLEAGADAAAHAESVLTASWTQISKSVEEDVPVRLEVVFCPYKASMWDSLESVWKAAAEDPNCDAYVIPIPYFDRKPNGNFGEMHYEGLEYPEYVPVTYYKSYNFEIRKPDVVFIHNPYDDCNYVTSVHPAFYSSELKKYTEKLVYVPYFNTGGAMADTFEYVAVYEHCDYIVVQTEEQKEYLAEDIRDKALALGSPKYDKIINYQVKEEEIPESWKNKLAEKVIFYNTSISGVLQHGEQAIQKMLYVFNTFKESDITLLWRPHPLLKSTLKTMRPNLLPLFEKVEEAFQQVKNGIFDTTADAIMSVKLADAYIGEESSSMVHHFGVQGKPIFLTDMDVVQNWDTEKENIKIFDCIYEKGFYWALCGDWNGLLKIDQMGNVIKIYEIPEEKRDNPRLYNSMVYHEGKLYMIPYTAKAIAIFDMDTEEFVKVSLDTPRRTNFSKAFLHKGKIYMIPTYYRGIVELECATEKLVCHDRVVEVIRAVYGNSEDVFSFNGSAIEDNKLLIAVAFGNCIAEMDLDTKEYKLHKISTGNDGYWCMAGCNGRYILGSNIGRRLVCWDRESNEAKEITAYPDGWQGETNCFYTMEKMENEVLVFSKTSNRNLRISMDDLSVSIFETDENHTPEERKNGYYSWPSNYLIARKLDDESVLVQSAYGYGLTILKTSGEAKHLSVRVPEQDFPYGYENLFCRRSKNLPWVMRENDKFSLASFAEYVVSNKHDADRQIREYSVVAANLDGTCGEKIYKTIVDEL